MQGLSPAHTHTQTDTQVHTHTPPAGVTGRKVGWKQSRIYISVRHLSSRSETLIIKQRRSVSPAERFTCEKEPRHSSKATYTVEVIKLSTTAA